MSSVIQSLKQIGSQVSKHRAMLIVYSIKLLQQSSLHWILLVENKVSLNFNKPTGRGKILNFSEIDCKISEEIIAEVFDFSYICELK